MKYFDKDFFKFTLGFLAIISLSLLIIIIASAYAEKAEAAGAVERIVFITSPQSIKPNSLSEPLTLQTQDSNGNQTQTPETIDLEFISSSPTGEFLSSTGNAVSAYMSKNTANRTFYYRDSAEGAFLITVKAVGRDSGLKWSANQEIKVGSGGVSVSKSNTTEETSVSSATSGSAPPKYGKPETSLEVTAGEDRLTSPGSPITLQAAIKKNSSADSSVKFHWSFGDGQVGSGPLVTHLYKYPGTYAVVLNASSGNTFAVSRLKVQVVNPEISLNLTENYIEMANNSDYEINLFGWKIINRDKAFIFQPDTIILPQSAMKFDINMLSMKGEVERGTVLKDSLGREVARATEKTVALPEPVHQVAAFIAPSTRVAAAVVSFPEPYNEVASGSEIIYESKPQKSLFTRLSSFIANFFK